MRTILRLLLISIVLFNVYFRPMLLEYDNNALTVSYQQPDQDATVEVDDEIDNTDVFQPKNYWQVIQPGQAIPRGLHVRMNLQTGLKEGKILSDVSNTKEHSDDSSTMNKYSTETLKEALKNINVENLGDSQPKTSKAKLRSLEELKNEFKELNLNIQSETDILIDLIKRYQKTQTEHDKIFVLQDMEYIAHQFDVAQNMVRLKCLELILPDLNSSDSSVRSLVAETLGAAMQGNPRVQIAVLEQNGVSSLLRVILFDESFKVRSKGLYALGCLLRHFPFAQERFLLNGGLQSLEQVLKEESAISLELRKMKLKVVTLLYDLLVEQDFAEKYRETKYEKISLRTHLVENGFCELVSDLLELQDMDTIERVIPTMVSLSPNCKFKTKLGTLQHLTEIFAQKLDLNNRDKELESLLYNIKRLLHLAQDKVEL